MKETILLTKFFDGANSKYHSNGKLCSIREQILLGKGERECQDGRAPPSPPLASPLYPPTAGKFEPPEHTRQS